MIRKEIGTLLQRVSKSAGFMHDHLSFVLASLTGGVVFTRRQLIKYRQHGQNMVGVGKSELFDKEKFFADLRIKLDDLQQVLPEVSKELNELRVFLRRSAARETNELVRSLPFLLFMRKDTWKDNFLGVAEGLFPAVYKNLQKNRKGS